MELQILKGLLRRLNAIMFENFLNLKREIDIQIHEAKRTRNGLNLNRAIPRNSIIKILKVNTRKQF